MVKHREIGGPHEFLGDTRTTAPQTLEALEILVQHAIAPPEPTDGLRLNEVHKLAVAEVRSLILNTAVHRKKHGLPNLTVDPAELLKHQTTRGLETLELHIVAVRRRLASNLHIQRHLEHVPQQIRLATERATHIVRCASHVREEHLVHSTDGLKPRLGAGVERHEIQICLLRLLQELVMAQNDLIEDIVVCQPVLVGDTSKRDIIQVAIGRDTQRTEDRDQRNRLTEPRNGDDRKTVVAPEISVGSTWAGGL